MRTAIIVQARETSTRLPGKALTPFPGFWQPISLIARRLGNVADHLIFAIPNDPSHDDLATAIERNLFATLVRGSLDDLADRRFAAANAIEAECYAIAGADDCLADAEPYRLAFALADQVRGYVQTEGWPVGCNAQVAPYWMYYEAFKEARGDEREHLTLFWDRNPQRYPRWIIRRGVDRSDLRITLDTPEDAELFGKIISALGPAASVSDIIEWLDANPLAQVHLPHYVPEGTPVPEGHGVLRVGDDPRKLVTTATYGKAEWATPPRGVGDL